MSKRKYGLSPIALVGILAIALILALYAGRFYRSRPSFLREGCDSFTKGWTDAQGEPISLPGKLSGQTACRIISALPDSLPDNAAISLSTNYLSVEAFVNGVSVYTWNPEENAAFHQPIGLSWYLIRLPQASQGKELELVLRSPYSNHDIQVNRLALGGETTLVLDTIAGNLDVVVLFFVLIIMAFLLLFPSVIFRRKVFQGASYLYLSLFMALAALWIITDANILLLFPVNLTFLCYVSYFCFMLMPVVFLLFIRELCIYGRRIFHISAAAGMLNFILCVALMLLGILDLNQTLFTTHLFILYTLIVSLVLCFFEFIKNKSTSMKEILLGMCVLGAAGIASLIRYYSIGVQDNSVLFRAGLSVFLFLLFWGALRRCMNQLMKSQSFETLARQIPGGICRLSDEQSLDILYANPFFYQIFNFTEKEAAENGFTCLAFIVHPDDFPVLKKAIKKAKTENRTSFELEFRHLKKHGETLWILACFNRMDDGSLTAVVIDITDRKQMEVQLRVREEEYRIAALHSGKMVLRYDVRKKTVYHQPGAAAVFGAPPVLSDVPESIIRMGVIAPDSVDAYRQLYSSILRGQPEGSAVVCIRDQVSGDFKWYRSDFTTVFDDDRTPLQAIISFYDVSQQREKEMAFEKWQQSYDALPRDSINYYEYNLTKDILEREEGDMLPRVPESVPRTVSAIALYTAETYVFPEDRAHYRNFCSVNRLLDCYDRGIRFDKIVCRRMSGLEDPLWTEASVQLIPDPYSSDVKGFILLQDIDEQKKTELLTLKQSKQDPLSGLLNRRAFIEQMNHLLKTGAPGIAHALIIMDIDYFKQVNDTLGHQTGDSVILDIAGKLSSTLRSGDLCGRLGGDEFIICLQDICLDHTLEKRMSYLCRLVKDDSRPGMRVSGSFGVAIYPHHGVTFQQLYQKADIALYTAKRQGRSQYVFYNEQMEHPSFSETETELTETIPRDPPDPGGSGQS